MIAVIYGLNSVQLQLSAASVHSTNLSVNRHCAIWQKRICSSITKKKKKQIIMNRDNDINRSTSPCRRLIFDLKFEKKI